MKLINRILLLVVGLGIASLAGCVAPGAPGVRATVNTSAAQSGQPRVPVKPPPGIIYQHIKAPLQYDLAHRGLATSVASRTASSEAMYLRIPFIYISFAWGDASIDAAADMGGIQEIAYADYEQMTILGLFTIFNTTVHGE